MIETPDSDLSDHERQDPAMIGGSDGPLTGDIPLTPFGLVHYIHEKLKSNKGAVVWRRK